MAARRSVNIRIAQYLQSHGGTVECSSGLVSVLAQDLNEDRRSISAALRGMRLASQIITESVAMKAPQGGTHQVIVKASLLDERLAIRNMKASQWFLIDGVYQRQCTHCGNWLPVESFSRDGGTYADGIPKRYSLCNPCSRKRDYDKTLRERRYRQALKDLEVEAAIATINDNPAFYRDFLKRFPEARERVIATQERVARLIATNRLPPQLKPATREYVSRVRTRKCVHRYLVTHPDALEYIRQRYYVLYHRKLRGLAPQRQRIEETRNHALEVSKSRAKYLKKGTSYGTRVCSESA